ncbi:hypothetical protein F4678DRAFT_474159 [Xylaria arbuscula]|nr:hypothetical protein F4678DRAFT_474159 [Xylaria arbuscula]
MSNPTVAAYVAFAFMPVIAFIGMWFAYRLYCLRRHCPMELYDYTTKIYYYPLVFIFSITYITIGIIFLVLTIIHGQTWANWCWRWSIVGSLADESICVLRTTREQGKYGRAVLFLSAIAAIETLLVIVSPAIPTDNVAQYLTLGAIICHSVWTALLASFWTPSRTKTVRLGASFGQGLGAVTSIWTPLAFVILVCSCSVIIYIEELNKSRQPLLPITSSHPRTLHSTTQNRQKYKIVFFGQGPERTQSLQKALDWPRVRSGACGLITYDHPTRHDTTLISVHPKIESEKDGNDYMRTLINGATAVVLVFNLCNAESFEYIKGLNGFPGGQPGLLVGCKDAHAELLVSEEDARDLANQNGWDFSMASEIVVAFESLLNSMFAKPHPKGRALF